MSTSEPPITLSAPLLGPDEAQALADALASGWITQGDRCAAFEAAFAALHADRQGDAPAALAVSSGTAALHLALAALGVGPGDEVVTTACTFAATVNAVLYAGATPVLADITSPLEPILDLAAVERVLTDRTRAILPMHYGGWFPDMAAWREFCDARGLLLVADACHAPGMAEAQVHAHAAAYSFYGNKNLTTAEGGMLLLNGPEKADAADRARALRSHGMTRTTLDRERGPAGTYDIIDLGWNYRLDDLRAAVGLAQLAHLTERNERRRVLQSRYRSRLAEKLPQVAIPFAPDRPTAAHLMPVLLPDTTLDGAAPTRPEIMTRMREAGIQTSVHYPAVHLFTYHARLFPGVDLPHTEAFADRILTLPLHPGLTEADVDRVVGALAMALV